MASHKRTSNAKGWGKSSPSTKAERASVFRRCGAGAFLKPDRSDPGASSFPVVAKRSQTCAPDCRGLLAAYRRADQYGRRSIARAARAKAKRGGCDWAR